MIFNQNKSITFHHFYLFFANENELSVVSRFDTSSNGDVYLEVVYQPPIAFHFTVTLISCQDASSFTCKLLNILYLYILVDFVFLNKKIYMYIIIENAIFIEKLK